MMKHFRMSSGITLASPSYINAPALIAPHNFLSSCSFQSSETKLVVLVILDICCQDQNDLNMTVTRLNMRVNKHPPAEFLLAHISRRRRD